MNALQFGGYYKLQVTLQNGQPLAKPELEKALTQMAEYNQDVAFQLSDGSTYMGRNDAQGNDYMGYYQQKNLVDIKMPDYRHLDPGGIKDILNVIGDMATGIARLFATPRYNAARKAFEADIQAKAAKNPTVKVIVTPTENGNYQFTKTVDGV